MPPHGLNHDRLVQMSTCCGEDTRPWTQSQGGSFAEYEGSHISEPLFSTYLGGMCVIWVKDIRSLECRLTNLILILLHDRCFIDEFEWLIQVIPLFQSKHPSSFHGMPMMFPHGFEITVNQYLYFAFLYGHIQMFFPLCFPCVCMLLPSLLMLTHWRLCPVIPIL